MEKKGQPELIVLLVMLVSGMLAVVSATGKFFGEMAGDVFIGSSIMLAGSLICRAMQWEGKE